MFNVLGANWDPTDKKFNSVNSYRQDGLPTCKAFPKETTTCNYLKTMRTLMTRSLDQIS